MLLRIFNIKILYIFITIVRKCYPIYINTCIQMIKNGSNNCILMCSNSFQSEKWHAYVDTKNVPEKFA